jgi:hypothetical protein
MNDLYQKFELQISSKDKEKIIQQLRNSNYLMDSVKEEFNLQWETGSGLTKKIYKDYEKKDFVRRETYQKLKKGYKPDHDIITISKTDNILTFERINE